jgi:uncharacterized protein YqgV (UPF0045/DUF77 family)
MIVAFSIAPAATDGNGSVSAAVADVVRIVRESGLPNETNAMFTNIEGEVAAKVQRVEEHLT